MGSADRHGKNWTEHGRTHAVTYGRSKPKPKPAPKERPQSTEEQDRERESLSELDAPFRCPPVRFPEGPSALSGMVRERRQSLNDWKRRA